MNKEFWRGKRVLLTGHTGFKGAWLAIWLHELGARVTGFSLPPIGDPNLFSMAGIAKLVDHHEGDLREFAQVKDVVAGARPEIVVHMAAQSLVLESYADPVGTFATNVMGTVHLLEAIRQAGGVRAVLVITTDKCYQNREWLWGYRETDRLGGHDPYSTSKACAELVVAGYRQSFFDLQTYSRHGVALASARAGNVIGGGDWSKDRLVPDVMRALAAGRRPLIRYPQAVRPWQHVLDPLRGYLMLIERMWTAAQDFAEAWNFGPPEASACSVGSIVQQLCALWGDGAGWECDESDRLHEAHYLKLDSSKARARIGWQPRWPLETALRKTVEAYRAKDIGEVVRRQIHEHSAAEPAIAAQGASPA